MENIKLPEKEIPVICEDLRVIMLWGILKKVLSENNIFFNNLLL